MIDIQHFIQQGLPVQGQIRDAEPSVRCFRILSGRLSSGDGRNQRNLGSFGYDGVVRCILMVNGN
ncbi:hypothetical protein D3C87_1699860 [compost metagenome]